MQKNLALALLFCFANATASYATSTQMDAQVDAKVTSCPDTSLGETQEDCPWAGIARGNVTDLKEAAPELFAQITHDAEETQLKNLWGQSINYDELAKGTIVDPAFLKALAKSFRVDWISDRISHAGLEHTYGYLFSTLKTAFGYKRARWVHGDTDRGFGLPAGTLSPDAPKSSGGTLFSNATYFFGKIAFRTEPKLTHLLDRHGSSVAKSLREFNYGSLKPIRLEEIIPSKKVVLRTDLIPFTVKPSGDDVNANQYLLIYSVIAYGQTQLITGFPVGQGFVDSTLKKEGLGDNKPIVTRYNAFVRGVSGETFTGTRKVISK